MIIRVSIFRLQGGMLNANSTSMNISRIIVINGWWWAR
ncbi:Hypothetical protein, conserved [Brucella abortus str. 2308 A]|uniref:Uncharacterized protein n=1 Tax=Brucella ovis (strain ATCC 25840 / 63/290 / NCTC 10512) TaxID=444178 RepID=A0A0H3AMB5_BRUO2|nr:hypothetical protein BOV_1517 [Brucella ovis ATCC 25840]EEP63471.1 Hypothetical protein, conserved [Brucella abortus str. 2308 A]EFM56778.1 Hypothetical protein BIBO1_1245 [Brucella inopinata BO1]EFM58311.1 Hypothetical protein BIBO2_2844 [Brucella sp. BO2]